MNRGDVLSDLAQGILVRLGRAAIAASPTAVAPLPGAAPPVITAFDTAEALSVLAGLAASATDGGLVAAHRATAGVNTAGPATAGVTILRPEKGRLTGRAASGHGKLSALASTRSLTSRRPTPENFGERSGTDVVRGGGQRLEGFSFLEWDGCPSLDAEALFALPRPWSGGASRIGQHGAARLHEGDPFAGASSATANETVLTLSAPCNTPLAWPHKALAWAFADITPKYGRPPVTLRREWRGASAV